MGFFDRMKSGKNNKSVKIFEKEMVEMSQEMLDLYLKDKGITFQQLEPLDRQILAVYLFGLVAAVNVEEERGYGPQDMGALEVTMIKETFHMPRRYAQVSAHDIVEQTKTHDPANAIYAILSRGEASWAEWNSGRKDRVVADMRDVVQMMHDIQNNVPVTLKEQETGPVMFKYHPNLYKDGDVVEGEGVCQCCGKTVDTYVTNLYCEEKVDCICLDCVQSGKAVEKFGGEFVQNVETLLDDPEKTDELLHRTPGYRSWQGEYWLTCCDDYCAYLGRVGYDELDAMGIAKPVCAEYMQRKDCLEGDIPSLLSKEGPVTGYLFQCLHCGKYHLWVDVQS